MRTCDCGGVVPEEDGPTHAYLHSEPACWRLYFEAVTSALEVAPASDVSFSHVDCFAAQHTRDMHSDRRQRSSVAVHLVALCLRVEHGITGKGLSRHRARAGDVVLPALGLDEWPLLATPPEFGEITAATLHATPERSRGWLLGKWPDAVWQAWQSEHETVRGWAGILLDARR